jgi:hypothetical protein
MDATPLVTEFARYSTTLYMLLYIHLLHIQVQENGVGRYVHIHVVCSIYIYI